MEQKKETLINKLLEQNQNPDFWKTIVDNLTGESHQLTDEQIQLIRKIQQRQYIDEGLKNKDYFYEIEKNPNPMTKKDETQQKKVSLNEKKMISKIVNAIKMGWMKLEPKAAKRDPFERFFEQLEDVWEFNPNKHPNRLPPIPAPKLELPGNEKSFNPAPEYFDGEVPAHFNMRGLESSSEAIKERFVRMMSLYLAPRVKRNKIHMTSQQLLEQLPDIERLGPYPQ